MASRKERDTSAPSLGMSYELTLLEADLSGIRAVMVRQGNPDPLYDILGSLTHGIAPDIDLATGKCARIVGDMKGIGCCHGNCFQIDTQFLCRDLAEGCFAALTDIGRPRGEIDASIIVDKDQAGAHARRC